MKIFSISVVLAPPSGACAILSNASDLSSFSFYQRGSVSEFMSFFSKTVSERTQQGQRQSVQENNYTAHVYNRGGAEQLAGNHMFSSVPVSATYEGSPQLLSLRTKSTLSDRRSRCSRRYSMSSRPRFPNPLSATLPRSRSPISPHTYRNTKIQGKRTQS